MTGLFASLMMAGGCFTIGILIPLLVFFVWLWVHLSSDDKNRR